MYALRPEKINAVWLHLTNTKRSIESFPYPPELALPSSLSSYPIYPS